MASKLPEVEDVARVHTPSSYSPDSFASARLSYYDERLSILEALSSDQLSSGGFGASSLADADIAGASEGRGRISVDDFEVSSMEDSASSRLAANAAGIHPAHEGRSPVQSESRCSLDESRIPLRQSWSEHNGFDEEILPLKAKKKKHVSLRIDADDDFHHKRYPSLTYLGEDGQTNQRKCHGNSGLLRGPRKVLRLCIFALLIPLGLVVVPLYIRTVRYPPQMIAMAPSDQRLLDSSVSSIWCQGQSVQMNGSFNAYLLPETPETKPARPRFTILKNLKLRDDVKEYWGFYLRGGSTVTLSFCTRYDGGQLMILRGSENLHRCAWIGEEDSIEETPVRMPSKADLGNVRVDLDVDSDENEEEGSRQIGSRVFTALKENVVIEGLFEHPTGHGVNSEQSENDEDVDKGMLEEEEDFEGLTGLIKMQYGRLAEEEKEEIDHLEETMQLKELQSEEITDFIQNPMMVKEKKETIDHPKQTMQLTERPAEEITKLTKDPLTVVDGVTEIPTRQISYQTSEERQEHLNLLLKHALAISKNKDEVMNALVSHTTGSHQENGAQGSGHEQEANIEDLGNILVTDLPSTPGIIQSILNNFSEKDFPSKTRTKRETVGEKHIPEDESADGAFEVTDVDPVHKDSVRKYTKEEIGVEQIIGGLTIPDGLTYERGFMNQSHGTDMSMEEYRSSYSSSEEALASCDGVILALPLRPDSHCSNFNRQGSNKVTYHITEDGTYYFVFSSDNEIVINDLFFNLTLDKVVYDTSANLANCSHSQNCSLHLDFWSNEHTVVEVPADSSWDHSYVLNTECQPRVAVYLCLLLLVPILILLCAFQ